jgi:hypothetical protein
MRYALIMLGCLCSTMLHAGDKPFVRVRWKEVTLNITYKGRSFEHNLRENSEERIPGKPYSRFFVADIAAIKTMYLSEENGSVYMLLDITGPSRGPGAASSFCGAGTESALVLFHFDQEGVIEEPSAISYESCVSTIETKAGEDDRPHVDDETHKIVTTFIYYRQLKNYDLRNAPPPDAMGGVTVRATFDPKQPERGIVTEETCLIARTSTPCPATQ